MRRRRRWQMHPQAARCRRLANRVQFPRPARHSLTPQPMVFQAMLLPLGAGQTWAPAPLPTLQPVPLATVQAVLADSRRVGPVSFLWPARCEAERRPAEI